MKWSLIIHKQRVSNYDLIASNTLTASRVVLSSSSYVASFSQLVALTSAGTYTHGYTNIMHTLCMCKSGYGIYIIEDMEHVGKFEKVYRHIHSV